MARSRHVRLGTTWGLSLALALAVVPAGSAAALRPADRQLEPSVRAAQPRTVVPARLPRGRDAAIDFMQDGVIHTAGGRTFPIRTPVDGEQRQLLGRSSKGWLVAVRRGDVSRVVAVRPGRGAVEVRRTRIAYSGAEVSLGWLLARDGEMLVLTAYDRGGSTRSARTLDGRSLESDDSSAFFTPMDADAGHVATYAEDESSELHVVDWVPGESRTPVAESAVHVSLRDDLVFTGTGRRFGPTSISAPGTPPWSAPIRPLAVSPDGETVAGLRIPESGFDDPAILDVRRMDDGTLLDSIVIGPRITMDNWSVSTDHEQTVRWESNRLLVLQLRSPLGDVLVRCRPGGTCRRASDYGGNISTPHETYLW